MCELSRRSNDLRGLPPPGLGSETHSSRFGDSFYRLNILLNVNRRASVKTHINTITPMNHRSFALCLCFGRGFT